MYNSFFRNLFQFGISRIFMSVDFMLALFITIAIERATINMAIISIDLEPILNVLVGLFSFVFAALAIMIAFSETGLGKLLTKMGKQKNILFHYWHSCVVYLTSILYVGFCLAIKTENKFLILGVIFSTLYAIFVTYSLVKTTISLGIYKDIHDTRENGQ